ncbi:SMP-30/gluconolactonase/LRE family protein [Pseudomonas sp. CCC3.1]|uniref:SMP-30/gluconolactonase/LRE family protein n=1 Tax=Pseudomonas sp. CCC3.1 TaxID=3048607 RepID=UPI002AC9E2EC|nr:SMP-30/gluconolactonase/LRE family protein [Pseudomonas sp. CCC3.1]MEB0205963.1 SMP-30/gluconolactonase/LRE family protein [Pseudomonas sp. CCC3.1]WPX38364.1 SMP-30/gluconolactonase/LRE family protein [Pseudomonas sp. CCC3.1]
MPITFTRLGELPDLLGESPVWDSENQCLYWVDSVSKLIRRYEPASGVFSHWQAPSMVGCVGLGQGRTLIVGLADGIYRMALDSGEFTPLLRPLPVNPDVRFNDGRTDRFGRFLCGSMGIHADPQGALYRVSVDGHGEMLANGIRIANTLCFSPDGDTMYFADSLDRTIRAYKYGHERQPLTEPRRFTETEVLGSGPDGATVDAQGYIWVALVQVGRIARFSADGILNRLIKSPTDMPSCLAFGGPDLSTLYVTSIKHSGTGRAISRHPDGGFLFAIDGLGVQGLPEPRFGQCPVTVEPFESVSV